LFKISILPLNSTPKRTFNSFFIFGRKLSDKKEKFPTDLNIEGTMLVSLIASIEELRLKTLADPEVGSASLIL